MNIPTELIIYLAIGLGFYYLGFKHGKSIENDHWYSSMVRWFKVK